VSKNKPKQGLVRKMTEQDLDLVLQWRNHIDVRRFMFNQKKIALEEHRSWFERVSQDSSRHQLIFEINSVPSGMINFSLHETATVADWGFYLAPDVAKGSGRQLGLVALDFAFGRLGLHKVCGEALAFNKRSTNFHLSLGFKKEGVLRENCFDGKVYHDVVCFGLLAFEWNQYSRESHDE
jgi:UDP-4-amino-4,6-dideoxy-N-acetyl-beta-L-altrosamine N-acetyltransferase